MIIFGKRLNGGLVRMERALSLMTLICLYIYETYSLVALRLMLIYGKSGTSQSNSLSISAVLILNPLLL